MPHPPRPIRAFRLPAQRAPSFGQAAAAEAALDRELILQLGALPLLLPLLERLGLREVVNRHCHPDGTTPGDLDAGLVAGVLVLNRLLAPQPLVHVETWLAGTALPDLWGLEAPQCNDDRLARTLDALAPPPGRPLAGPAGGGRARVRPGPVPPGLRPDLGRVLRRLRGGGPDPLRLQPRPPAGPPAGGAGDHRHPRRRGAARLPRAGRQRRRPHHPRRQSAPPADAARGLAGSPARRGVAGRQRPGDAHPGGARGLRGQRAALPGPAGPAPGRRRGAGPAGRRAGGGAGGAGDRAGLPPAARRRRSPPSPPTTGSSGSW